MVAGTSGGGISDLNPESQYDVDARRLDEDERATSRAADTRNEGKQRRVEKFLRFRFSDLVVLPPKLKSMFVDVD